ncbi:unnamed protein product [Ectocarpus sp. CCAP 1310/34]|nr:unnamed protein product [Ectocarpus sp. CCAP 1310/34]
MAHERPEETSRKALPKTEKLVDSSTGRQQSSSQHIHFTRLPQQAHFEIKINLTPF